MTHYQYNNYDDDKKPSLNILWAIIIAILIATCIYLYNELNNKQYDTHVYLYAPNNINQNDINQAAVEVYDDYLYYNNKN